MTFMVVVARTVAFPTAAVANRPNASVETKLASTAMASA
jgi:hypothetical protein